MRLALFGGTFDPIHSGHVEAARAAADAAGLDRVLVVPSGRPPHKQHGCRASYEDRYRMVELACALDARLQASRLEEPRPDGEPHYSIDTIRRVQASFDFAPPLRFVVGADAFAEAGQWREAERIFQEVGFVVVARPEFDLPSPEPPARSLERASCAHPASSREMRHRVKIGGSLADLAPPAVCAYIWERGLYRL